MHLIKDSIYNTERTTTNSLKNKQQSNRTDKIFELIFHKEGYPKGEWSGDQILLLSVEILLKEYGPKYMFRWYEADSTLMYW